VTPHQLYLLGGPLIVGGLSAMLLLEGRNWKGVGFLISLAGLCLTVVFQGS
jgi:hypothetical protein